MSGSSAEYTRQWREANKEKVLANRKAYYLANKEKIAEANKDWAKRNPEKKKLAWVKRKCKLYGITLDQYNQLLTLQDNKCACCRSPDPKGPWSVFAIDHDHDTGKIRGLLCFECNTGIGNLGDSIEGLQSALDYLKRANA